MKAIKLLFLLLIFSCAPETSQEEIECRCTKQTYNYIQESVIGSNGLPTIEITKNIISNQEVVCQPEQTQVQQGDLLFDIICE